jgi:prepilin peptidase CpaA
MGIFSAVVALTYAFLLCFAVVSDFRKLRIPNWISLALVALFCADMLWASNERLFLHHLGIAAAVFAGGLALYVFGWWAAGDVKLMTAIALWAGPPKIVDLLIGTGLLGGLMAVGILVLRKVVRLYGLDLTKAGAALPGWVKLGLIPYGVAIAIAGLIVRPLGG